MDKVNSRMKNTDIEIVDAYLHCGMRKYHPIEKVREVMSLAGVARAVLVQHLGEFDNSYIGDIVAMAKNHFAGVCLVDHTASNASLILEQISASGNFKGVRFTTDTLKIASGLWKIAADLKLIIVLYMPQGIVDFVKPLKVFLDANPECHLVLTHMGNPDIREAPYFKMYRKIFALAKYPGVYYQISGMKMFCSYPHEVLYGLISEAVGYFGTSRILWGSNYPVVGDEQDYIKDLHLLFDGRLPIPDNAISDVAGGNACKLWFPKSI